MPIRLAVCLVCALPVWASAQEANADDRAAVVRAVQAYRDAWLANDRAAVMATLTADAAIFPSGLPPLAGADAIARFWFPDSGPVTTVTAIEAGIDEVHVEGELAVASGRGSLTFVVAVDGRHDPPRTQRHWHVNVLRRQPDGRWLIWRRMWGDLR
ncbi:MAG: DUF4440 domain-containing protein [Vicinamibacterales bacterium]